MKQIITLLFALFSFLQMNAQTPSLEINFTTESPGGTFSPRHILAVWVENEDGSFVKTQLVFANARKQYLYTWNSSPANGNEIDAVTGATQTSHKTYTVTWDCLDLEQNIIPSGNYILHIEMTDRHNQGPLAEINFTIDENAFTLNPTDETNFKDISLVYSPDNISVENIKSKNKTLEIYPNPAVDFVNFSFNINNDEIVNIEIYDEKFSLINKVVTNKFFPAGKNTTTWNVDRKIPTGNYFVLFSTSKHVWFGKKIIIKN